MTTNGFHVRPYRSGDEHAILALHNEVFSAGNPEFVPRTPQVWNWEYRDCPLGLRVVVAEDGDGRLVAHYAAVPVRFQAQGAEVVVAQGVDSMVHPSWRRGLRRESVFLAVAQAYFARFGNGGDCYCTYGFPCRSALRIGISALGYQPVHWPVSTLYRNAFERYPRDPGLEPPAGVEVREVPRFGTDLDVLWRSVAAQYPFAAIRDSRYLNWRYADSPIGYRLWEIRAHGGLRAAFVLQERWQRRPILALVDLVAAADDGESLGIALRSAWRTAVAAGDIRLETWLPTASAQFQQAIELGLRSEAFPLAFCVRFHRPDQDLEWYRRHWFFTIGDSDIF